MKLSRMVARIQQLSPADRLVLLHALWLLPTIHLLVYLFGFRRAVAFARRLGHGRWNLLENQSTAARITYLAQLAARRGVAHGNCLSQSLTLWWLLRRHGIASDLRIGVRKAGEGLEAHAWVELDNIPLNDRRNVQSYYATFEPSILPRVGGWI